MESAPPDDTPDRIRHAVDSLPPRQRLAVILKRFEGLSYAEIAEVMEIKPGTVEQTLNQAYQSLREKLAPQSMRS